MKKTILFLLTLALLPVFLLTSCSSQINQETINVESDKQITNETEDIKELEIACIWGNSKGCSNLGVLYDEGKGVEQDYFKAKDYFEKACNLNSGDGCYYVGRLHHNGNGVKQDYFKAKDYFEKACNLNNALGCVAHGALYILGEGVKQDKFKAKEYFGKACDLKEQKGCEFYAKYN
jgi:TPR repeat protein